MQYSSVGTDAQVPFQRVAFKMRAPSAITRGKIVRLQIASDRTVTMVNHAVDGDSASATNPVALYGVVDKDVAGGEVALVIVSGIVEVSFYGQDSDGSGSAIEAGDAVCPNENYGGARVWTYGALAKAGDIALGVVLGVIGVEVAASGAFGYANVLFNGIDKFPQR